jgi:hypothetical protein
MSITVSLGSESSVFSPLLFPSLGLLYCSPSLVLSQFPYLSVSHHLIVDNYSHSQPLPKLDPPEDSHSCSTFNFMQRNSAFHAAHATHTRITTRCITHTLIALNREAEVAWAFWPQKQTFVAQGALCVQLRRSMSHSPITNSPM